MSKVHSFTAPLRALFALLLLALAGVGIAPRALAQANAHPPERMTYQGFLVDANGTPLGTNAPKNYDVVFRIWSNESSTAVANRLWTEQQTVTVDKGYFSVLLGEGSSIGEPRPDLSTLFTNSTASDRWVGLTVKGIGAGGTDVNILPRLRLLSSPYAYLARGVSGAGVVNANNLDPAIANSLWTAGGGNVYRASGNVGIGTSTPGFPLNFGNVLGGKISLWGQSGNTFGFGIQNSLLQIHTDGVGSDVAFGYGSSAAMTETMRVRGNGQVGIGTSTINGNARLQVAGGSIMPSAGDSPAAGIYFPPDPGGGGLDTAYLRYYPRSGEACTLELGISNDADDHIALMPGSGNVGVGTITPAVKFDVVGRMRVDNGIAAAPANGTFGSSGTRITLWPGSATSTPFGFGIDGGTLWSGVPSGNTFQWYNGTVSKMRLQGDGALHLQDGVTGSGARLRVNTGGYSDVAVSMRSLSTDNHILNLDDSGGNIRFIFRNDGTPFRTGGTTWAIWSDARLKQKVDNLQGSLDQLLKLRSVNFEYKDGERYGKGMQRGFLAQEVEKVFPDWIHEAPDGMMAVECKGFEALTVEALRELRAEKDEEIKRLDEENTRLRAAVDAQERRLAALEALVRQAAAPAPTGK